MAAVADADGSAAHLQHANAIAELAAERADEVDRERALPAALVALLRSHGFFRLLVPQRFGGAELSLPEYLPLVEAIARGDASTAWCLNQAAVYATMASRAHPVAAANIWGDPNTSVANGPPAAANVIPAPDGHRISGQWEFSSGCRHANWVAAATPINHVLTVSMIPIKKVELIDAWLVQGLRGTGSFAFNVNDVYVPKSYTFDFSGPPREPGPLYRIPTNLLFAAGFACVALGNARAALDAAVELLGNKRPVFERNQSRERGSVQLDIARAEAIWGAARAYLMQHADAIWSSAQATGGPSAHSRIGLRLAATHAIQCAAEAVQIVYRLCGSTSIFTNQPIQRRFQDAHVITQQVQGRTTHYETVGQYFLGLNPKPVFF